MFAGPMPPVGRKETWPNGAVSGQCRRTSGGLGGEELDEVDAELERGLELGGGDGAGEGRQAVLAGALAEPLAVALHGLSKAGDVAGKKVLVTGAGPSGLLAVAAAVAAGAEVDATDVLCGPLERARALGARTAYDVTTDEVPAGAYDVVLECSGVAASVSTALQAVCIAGAVVQVGMVPDEPCPINIAPFISKEVRWYGSFRFKDEIDRALVLLAASPAVEDVITHESRRTTPSRRSPSRGTRRRPARSSCRSGRRRSDPGRRDGALPARVKICPYV